MPEWGAILLAGGADPHGSRDFAVVDVGCLAPVATRPLIEHAILRVARAGVSEVVVVGEAQIAESVRAPLISKDFGIPVRHVVVPDGAGDLAAVLAAREALEARCVLIHMGDIFVGDDIAPLMSRVSDGSYDGAILARAGSPARARRTARGRGGVREAAPAISPAGVIALGPGMLSAVEELEAGRPGQGRLEQLAEFLHRSGRRLDAVVASSTWRYRRGAEALLEGNRLALERIESDIAEDALEDSTVQGRAVIHTGAHLQRTLVRGPVVIDRDVRLVDAYVGPYTSVGERAVIEGTEVENSVLLPRAELRHVGFRVEASVLAAGARVVRSFALPKAMHVHLGPQGRMMVS